MIVRHVENMSATEAEHAPPRARRLATVAIVVRRAARWTLIGGSILFALGFLAAGWFTYRNPERYLSIATSRPPNDRSGAELMLSGSGGVVSITASWPLDGARANLAQRTEGWGTPGCAADPADRFCDCKFSVTVTGPSDGWYGGGCMGGGFRSSYDVEVVRPPSPCDVCEAWRIQPVAATREWHGFAIETMPFACAPDRLCGWRSDPHFNVYLPFLYPPSERTGYRVRYDCPPNRSAARIAAPFWAPTLLFAVVPSIALLSAVQKRLRVRAGLCVNCGYDLRASPERCPECGILRPQNTRPRLPGVG